MEERLRVWPLGRLRSEGLVLLELVAARRGSYLGKAIVRLTAGDGGDLPFHRFTCVGARGWKRGERVVHVMGPLPYMGSGPETPENRGLGWRVGGG